MNLYKEVDLRISVLLKDMYSKLNWTHFPQIGHLPTDKSREGFFLLINIYVKPEWVDREKQIDDCLMVARVVIGSGLLTDKRAVEISAFIIDEKEKTSTRVFRLSVCEIAFLQAMNIEVSDLVNKKTKGLPANGQSYL